MPRQTRREAMAHRASGVARLLALLVAAATLAGCQSVSYGWERPNGSRADFDRDAYGCERDIRQSLHVNRETVGGYFERCLRAHGWTDTAGRAGFSAPVP